MFGKRKVLGSKSEERSIEIVSLDVTPAPGLTWGLVKWSVLYRPPVGCNSRITIIVPWAAYVLHTHTFSLTLVLILLFTRDVLFNFIHFVVQKRGEDIGLDVPCKAGCVMTTFYATTQRLVTIILAPQRYYFGPHSKGNGSAPRMSFQNISITSDYIWEILHGNSNGDSKFCIKKEASFIISSWRK